MRFFKKTSKHLQMSTNMHILVTPNKKKKKSQWLHLCLKTEKTWKCIPHVLYKIYTILVYICLLFPNTYLGFGGISRLKNN